MYILSLGTVVEKLFRNIFFLIDDVIYRQIPKIYDLLITIARTSPLSQANIADLASRIYKLLAVFMMFKVILSLIMYVVNPDDFSDKSKGVSKLVTNIVISLALLVLTPYFFSYAYQFQTIILEDNALATIIFGNDIGEDSHVLQDAGKQIAYLASSPFLTPNLEYFACSIITIDSVGSDGKVHTQLNPDCFGFSDVYAYYEKDSECMERVDDNSQGFVTLCGALDESKSENDSYLSKEDVQTYAAGVLNGNFNLTFRKKLVTAMYEVPYHLNKTKVFAFDYSFIMSTIVGVVTLLFLITTCMDVALRSIKLAFLQLIAPIPILSYIDPKSGKDGMFKKWYQLCLKTYLALFLKLLALYFAIYIISKIGHMVDIIDGSYVTNGLIKIFIIIGALMFAKNFTKILESLGVKLDGGFQLNPFKKLENEALGMKKPAAFANKLAKGILTSPVSGLQTLGKKTIGGIDAAKNGKGFKQGWNRTHGNLHNKFYKKLDEWAPDSAEARKNERIGRENINQMDEKAKFGADVYRRAGGDGSKGLPDLFKSNEYRRSYEAMDKEKKAMYAAQAKGEREKTDVQEQLKRGLITGEAADEAFKRINKEVGTAEKRYNVANKRHEEMKKIYAGDAKTEDAFDYYDKTTSQIDKDILLGKKPAEPVTKQNNQDQQRNEQYTVDNQNSNDQSSTTNSESTESPDIDTSTNTENVEDSSFEPIYRDLDEQLQAAYKEYAQYGDISGTADDAAKREEIEKQIKDLHNKKIDDKIRILQAELVQYDGIAMTPEDIKKQNEILEEIAKLQRQKR